MVQGHVAEHRVTALVNLVTIVTLVPGLALRVPDLGTVVQFQRGLGEVFLYDMLQQLVDFVIFLIQRTNISNLFA